MPSKHGKGWRARWTDEHGKRQSESFKYRRHAEQFERTKKAQTEQVHRGLRRAAPVATVDRFVVTRAHLERELACLPAHPSFA